MKDRRSARVLWLENQAKEVRKRTPKCIFAAVQYRPATLNRLQIESNGGAMAKKEPETVDPTESLTVFLAKEGLAKPGDLLKVTSGLKQTFKIADQDGELGTLYIQRRSSHIPRWAKFFEGQIEEKEFGRVSSAAAVLVVPLEQRTALLAFGQGRHLINLKGMEDRFGPSRIPQLHCRRPRAESGQAELRNDRPPHEDSVEQGSPPPRTLGLTTTKSCSERLSVRRTTRI